MTSGLGPLGDLYVLTSILRTDGGDVGSYARLLTEVLGSALPPGMVDVDYERSLADRLAGRPGTPTRVRVRSRDGELVLRHERHGARGEIRHIVSGVVISRRPVAVDEWLAALATELQRLADENAAAASALRRLLDVDP